MENLKQILTRLLDKGLRVELLEMKSYDVRFPVSNHWGQTMWMTHKYKPDAYFYVFFGDENAVRELVDWLGRYVITMTDESSPYFGMHMLKTRELISRIEHWKMDGV